MKFTKMQGCGNDYIFIDATKTEYTGKNELAIKMSDRHFGVGSDGLVFIEKSKIADFKMDFYNSDGTSAEMCGTALRCLCKFVCDNHLAQSDTVTVETAVGIRTCKADVVNGAVVSVTVDMGNPIFKAEQIPVDFHGDKVFGYPLQVGEEWYYINALSMGNPHAVIFCKDVASINLDSVGSLIENHAFFPNRTNVEFIYPCADEISMRVYERGTGETLSCGSGACAATVVAVMAGLCDENVKVNTKGGTLEVYYNRNENSVYLKGECVKVFDGDFAE